MRTIKGPLEIITHKSQYIPGLFAPCHCYESVIAKLRHILLTSEILILRFAPYILGKHFTYHATVFCSLH